MSPDEKNSDPTSEGYDDYVTAVVARNLGEAEQYRDLLSDHDIPAFVGDKDLNDVEEIPKSPKVIGRGIQVLVPEVLLDEASEIIADREDAEEFAIADEDVDGDDDDEEEDLGLDTEIDPDVDDALFIEDDDDDDEPFIDGLDDDDVF